MKFVVLVEGDVEQKVLPRFLRGYLTPRLSASVGVHVINFSGCYRFVEDIATQVQLHMSGPKAADTIGCIGLLDLYGPTFFPADKKTAEERRQWGRQHLESRVNHARFRQHFAVHELEAWILAQPEVLPSEVRKGLPGKCNQPETVNFGEPPAKLLKRLYDQRLHRPFRKMTDGVGLFEKLNPATVAAKCPGLQALLDDMLQMARDAGL